MTEEIFDPRARTKEIAAEYMEKGDALGWFDALYKEAAGDNEQIPWADLEPNRFLVGWAESVNLQGNGRTALVVGCGLGDDAKFLNDRGFKVTAFDISETAIEWAKKLHSETGIEFHTADLFDAPAEWKNAFEFVLEVYTIQPLPVEIRPQVIDAIAGFVKAGGELVVVTRGREDDEETPELPWALSRHDLSRFEHNGLKQIGFTEMPGDEEEVPMRRFIVLYKRPLHF
jgi:SAM-dependent methyltransferase